MQLCDIYVKFYLSVAFMFYLCLLIILGGIVIRSYRSIINNI